MLVTVSLVQLIHEMKLANQIPVHDAHLNNYTHTLLKHEVQEIHLANQIVTCP
jgi:hypothetical protein